LQRRVLRCNRAAFALKLLDMTVSQPHSAPAAQRAKSAAKYLVQAPALHFPTSQEVPETQLHLDLRTLLYQLLSDYLGLSHTVGSDQFVYFDASNPKVCLAPDVYVKCTPRAERVTSWKTWERGAPEVAVEVISDSDSTPADWSAKLRAYQALGVKELVCVDLLRPQPSLRIWDRVEEALSERVVEGLTAPSFVLPLHWGLGPADTLPLALRIASLGSPSSWVPTQTEARHAEAKARHAEAKARQAEAEARLRAEEQARLAEARVRELEALLREKG
jgi:Uma2 family endonuclease